MKSNSRIVLANLSLCIGLLSINSAQATTYPIAFMDITSGGFTAYDYLGRPFYNPSSGGTYTPFTTFASNTNLVGSYLGSTGSGFLSGIWHGGVVQMYTASSNLGGVNAPAGSVQGGPVPYGTLDDIAGTITMDLSALFAYWGVDFNQGTGKVDGVTSSIATGTWNPNSNLYTMSWLTNIDPSVCGPLGPTCSAQYTLQGYAMTSAVPIPAASFLLASGLLGLVGIARKR